MDTTISGIGQLPTSTTLQAAVARSNPGPRAQDGMTIPANAPARSDNKEASAPDEVRKSVEAMNDFVRTINSDLKFSVDEDTGKTVVKVVDQATDQVIRQIPAEEVLAIAKALDKLKGLLIHQKA